MRGGLTRGQAALALDGGGQRAALAADKSARAAVDVHMEGELGAQDVVAQKAQLLGLSDGIAQALDGQRILGADVDIALARPAGARRDHHALDHAVGVTLHDASIHERARIALVAVADDVFLRLLLPLHLRPLAAGGESSAPAAPQAGFRDLVDNLVAGHVEERLFKGGIAVQRDILADGGGVDMAAVLQHDAVLLLVEGDVLLTAADFAHLVIGQAIDVTAVLDGFLNDLLAVRKLNLGVQPALRIDAHQRAHLAEAMAAALLEADGVIVRLGLQLHLDGDAGFLHQLAQAVEHLEGTAGHAARAAADDDLFGLQLIGFLRNPAIFDQILSALKHSSPPPSVPSKAPRPSRGSSRGERRR